MESSTFEPGLRNHPFLQGKDTATLLISTKCLIVNEISKQIRICTSVEVISSLQTVVIHFFYFSFIVKFNASYSFFRFMSSRSVGLMQVSMLFTDDTVNSLIFKYVKD